LHLNIDKHVTLFTFILNLRPISLKINCVIIKHVNSCKYLGVLIDDELKWTTHIDTVVQKLQRVMGIMVYVTKLVINYLIGAYAVYILHLCTSIFCMVWRFTVTHVFHSWIN